MIQNVIIGELLCEPKDLFAYDEKDWIENESKVTLYTDERFLPRILVQSGVVSSVSEVRRNKPELCVELQPNDYLEIKWGKKRLFIGVGK